jgi:NAD(P)H-dependent FMN reductase
MITLISGTNRPGSKTLKISQIVRGMLQKHGEEVSFVDLAELPGELFSTSSYGEKPATFAPFQDAVLKTDGILTIVPEYNGSFPGVLKYFIDMLRFPDSLYEKPAAFIGISAGPWGAVRAVEHLEMIFQYRHAHLFGRRCFIPGITTVINEAGAIEDPALAERLEKTVRDFSTFCRRLGDAT